MQNSNALNCVQKINSDTGKHQKWVQVELLMLNNTTWNHLILCKQMRFYTLKNVTLLENPYIYIYVCVCVIHRETVSLRNSSSVWLYPREASSHDRNLDNFTSVGYLSTQPSSSLRKWRNYIYIYICVCMCIYIYITQECCEQYWTSP